MADPLLVTGLGHGLRLTRHADRARLRPMPRFVCAFALVFALPSIAQAEGEGSTLAVPVGLVGSYGLEESYRIGVGLRGGVRAQPLYFGLSVVNHFGESDANVLYGGPEVGLAARLPLVVAMATSSVGMLRVSGGGADDTEIFLGPGVSLVSAPSSPLAPFFVGVDARYIWLPGADDGSSAAFSLWVGMEFGGAGEPAPVPWPN